ncbi:MAG: phosphonopyruvate decarboxylase [Clostridium butyricum]|nr:phosphonopyruvate decarboxylase [Clostridium butyricum]
MINVEEFYKELMKNNIEFFTGVPDSLLKSFCAYIKDNVCSEKNIIAANEGNAVAIASGYYLSTGKIGLVYMQNSGIGNAINPIASLVDEKVYKIPMLMLIGWRGEPGKKDEPQHKKQGIITLELLEVLGIKYKILDENMDNYDIKQVVKQACEYIAENNVPFAFVVRKNTFNEYKLKSINKENELELTREKAIEIIASNIDKSSAVISTTGMASRELFEIRERFKEEHNKDFLTVGSMGHASQIALGIALNSKDRNVYCIDGDGALIMHLGGLAIIGNLSAHNYKHIVINNGAHDSVGGQETVGLKIDIPSIAKACGYKKAYSCSNESELNEYIKIVDEMEGPVLLEVKVKKGARKDLGRPTTTPIENKEAFIRFLNGIG